MTTQEGIELQKQVNALKKLAVGQAAMIALLTALLAHKGVLTKEEGSMVAAAALDADDHTDLKASDVIKWIKREITEGRVTKGDDG